MGEPTEPQLTISGQELSEEAKERDYRERSLQVKPIPMEEKKPLQTFAEYYEKNRSLPSGMHAYHILPDDPQYTIGASVMTINDEKGTIVDLGQNFFGNMYRVQMTPIDNPEYGPIQVDIQEDSLFTINEDGTRGEQRIGKSIKPGSVLTNIQPDPARIVAKIEADKAIAPKPSNSNSA